MIIPSQYNIYLVLIVFSMFTDKCETGLYDFLTSTGLGLETYGYNII